MRPPESPEPNRFVLEVVIEIDQKRRAGFQKFGTGPDAALRVGHVMQNAQAIAEILRARIQHRIARDRDLKAGKGKRWEDVRGDI